MSDNTTLDLTDLSNSEEQLVHGEINDDSEEEPEEESEEGPEEEPEEEPEEQNI